MKDKFYGKWWFWVIVLIFMIFVISIFDADCPTCNSSCAKERADFIEMCELYNTQAVLSNAAIEYIDTFANPDNVYLTKQVLLDCYSY